MILQSLEALENDVKSVTGRSFYLILGPEQYLCRLAVDIVKRELLNPEGFEFDFCTYSAKETSVERIMETANTYPMVSKRRVVLVTDVEKMSENEQGRLLEALDSLAPRSMLILLADELDHRRRFYKTIQEKGCIAEFPKMKGAALERWVETFAKRKGYRISPATAGKIVNLAGSDLQSLVGEMEKLFLFAGKENRITDAAVDDLVRSSRNHGIFELIDAIGRRDRAAALGSLANLMEMGEYPLVIVTMMARQSRQVLIVKECLDQGMNSRAIGGAAQIPPFILDKFIRQAKTIPLETARKMHTGLSDIDRRLKSSSVDARMLLEVFICALV